MTPPKSSNVMQSTRNACAPVAKARTRLGLPARPGRSRWPPWRSRIWTLYGRLVSLQLQSYLNSV